MYPAAGAGGDGGGCGRAVSEVPASGLPGAVVCDVAVVRVPVPRVAVQPGGGEEGWSGSSGDGSLRDGGVGWGVDGRHRSSSRAADRYEHHRPGSRRPALRERRTPLMYARRWPARAGRRPARRSATCSPSLLLARASRSPSWSTCARAAPRSAPRSSSRPTASRTCDDDELETKKLDRTLGLGLVLLVRHRRRPAALLAGRAGRQADAVEGFEETFIARGEDIYVERRPVRQLPWPRGRRRRGQLHPHRPADRRLRRPGQLAGAGAQHGAVPLHPRGGEVHPQLRPRQLPDAGLGRPRWWSAHRPAARRHHRLPHIDPASRRRGREAAVQDELDDVVRAPTPPATAPSPDAEFKTLGEAIFNLG